MKWLMRCQVLEGAAFFILVGWVAVAWLYGNAVGDNVGSISLGVFFALLLVRGIVRLKAGGWRGED